MLGAESFSVLKERLNMVLGTKYFFSSLVGFSLLDWVLRRTGFPYSCGDKRSQVLRPVPYCPLEGFGV